MLFEQVEKHIYSQVCAHARQITTELLEAYDKKLCKERNKDEYKILSSKPTTIKTVYGEVVFKRRYYRHLKANDEVENVYLLDETLQMASVGQYSENLAQIIASAASELSYRQTAEKIQSMTGVYISHGGVWEVIQALGKKAAEEEAALTEAMKHDALRGEVETPILFEEMDGVYLSIQGNDRKKYKKGRQEMKVSLAYSGWQQEGKKMRLVNKVMAAGFHPSNEFHAIREAGIRKVYNTDEITHRVLNGDGAQWIKNTYEADTIYQLDRFHIQQELTRCIPHKEARKAIQSKLREGAIDECLDFIEAYANSIEGTLDMERTVEAVHRLHSYLSDNKEGLIPYTKRGLDLPEPPEGVLYRENLGTQENHNYSVITKRMKHRRASWSLKGATNMAKILTQRENGTLDMLIRNTTAGELNLPPISDAMINDVLSASKAPKADGKGYMKDPVHVLLGDWKQSPGIKQILGAMKLQSL